MPGLGAAHELSLLVRNGTQGSPQKADIHLGRFDDAAAHDGIDPQQAKALQQAVANQAVGCGDRRRHAIVGTGDDRVG